MRPSLAKSVNVKKVAKNELVIRKDSKIKLRVIQMRTQPTNNCSRSSETLAHESPIAKSKVAINSRSPIAPSSKRVPTYPECGELIQPDAPDMLRRLDGLRNVL